MDPRNKFISYYNTQNSEVRIKVTCEINFIILINILEKNQVSFYPIIIQIIMKIFTIMKHKGNSQNSVP